VEEEDAKESKRFFDKISAIRRKLIKEHEAKRERALLVEEVEANKKEQKRHTYRLYHERKSRFGFLDC